MAPEGAEKQLIGLAREARKAAEGHWQTIAIAMVTGIVIISIVSAIARYVRRRRRKSTLRRMVEYVENLGGHRDQIEKFISQLERA